MTQIPDDEIAPTDRALRSPGVVAAVLVLVAVLLATLGIYTLERSHGYATATAYSQLTPPNAALVSGDPVGVVGSDSANADGPTVVIYEDYQCSSCAAYETGLLAHFRTLAEKNEIRLEYRTMTFLDRGQADGVSARSATAAACADLQGAFDDYHLALFANQSAFTDAQLLDLAHQVGLSGTALKAFRSCFVERRTAEFVATVNTAANHTEVTQVPTVYVNGAELDLSTVTASEAGVRAAIAQLVEGA